MEPHFCVINRVATFNSNQRFPYRCDYGCTYTDSNSLGFISHHLLANEYFRMLMVFR